MPSCLWEAHTVERRRAWHDITALGRHARSNDIGRGMTSPPLDSTDNRQRRAWHDITAIGQHTVERRQAWHNITALGQHTRLDYVRRGMTSLPFYSTRSNDVGRDMPSPPLESTHGRTTSVVACHHHLWAAQTVKRRRAWHAIIALERQTWSNDVGCGMHHRHGQHTQSNVVRHVMLSSPLGSTHGRTTLGVALHHHPWNTRTVGRRRAWHDIIPLGKHTRLATSGVA